MADLISLDEQRLARMTAAERRKHDLDACFALLDEVDRDIERAEELLAQSRALGLESQLVSDLRANYGHLPGFEAFVASDAFRDLVAKQLPAADPKL